VPICVVSELLFEVVASSGSCAACCCCISWKAAASCVDVVSFSGVGEGNKSDPDEAAKRRAIRAASGLGSDAGGKAATGPATVDDGCRVWDAVVT